MILSLKFAYILLIFSILSTSNAQYLDESGNDLAADNSNLDYDAVGVEESEPTGVARPPKPPPQSPSQVFEEYDMGRDGLESPNNRPPQENPPDRQNLDENAAGGPDESIKKPLAGTEEESPGAMLVPTQPTSTTTEEASLGHIAPAQTGTTTAANPPEKQVESSGKPVGQQAEPTENKEQDISAQESPSSEKLRFGGENSQQPGEKSDLPISPAGDEGESEIPDEPGTSGVGELPPGKPSADKGPTDQEVMTTEIYSVGEAEFFTTIEPPPEIGDENVVPPPSTTTTPATTVVKTTQPIASTTEPEQVPGEGEKTDISNDEEEDEGPLSPSQGGTGLNDTELSPGHQNTSSISDGESVEQLENSVEQEKASTTWYKTPEFVFITSIFAAILVVVILSVMAVFLVSYCEKRRLYSPIP